MTASLIVLYIIYTSLNIIIIKIKLFFIKAVNVACSSSLVHHQCTIAHARETVLIHRQTAVIIVVSHFLCIIVMVGSEITVIRELL